MDVTQTQEPIIYLKINQEKDLYHPLDPEKNLSEDVKTYINGKTKLMRAREGVHVRIVSKEPVCEADVRAAFQRWGEETRAEMKQAARKNLIKMIWLFLFGILVIALALFLQSRVSTLLYTIITTVGTFSIWEGASVWIIKGPELRAQKKIMESIVQSAAIEFALEEENIK